MARPTKYKPEYCDAVSGIYALKCPYAGVIRYVGKSKNIRRRYADHCRNMGMESPKTHYQRWISGLDIPPGIVILEKTVLLDEAEVRWIKEMSISSSLTNIGTGGEGYPKSPVYILARKMRKMFTGSGKINDLVESMIKSYQESEASEKYRMNCLADKKLKASEWPTQ